MEAPDKLYNEHDFKKEVVDVAASVMQKWFMDKDLGMCRVAEFGGYYKLPNHSSNYQVSI